MLMLKCCKPELYVIEGTLKAALEAVVFILGSYKWAIFFSFFVWYLCHPVCLGCARCPLSLCGCLGQSFWAHPSLVLARMFYGSRQVLQLAASYLVFLLSWYLNETTSVMPCSSQHSFVLVTGDTSQFFCLCHGSLSIAVSYSLFRNRKQRWFFKFTI